jgi:hypothetical protein
LVGGNLTDIMILDNKPSQAIVIQLYSGNRLGGPEAGVLLRRLQRGGTLKGKSRGVHGRNRRPR